MRRKASHSATSNGRDRKPSDLANIVNYGYGQETLHIVDMQVPADWPAGTPITLSASANWLICSDICVPESATLSLTVPTATTEARTDPAWAGAFERAYAAIPEEADWPSPHRASRRAPFTCRCNCQSPCPWGSFTVFPVAQEVVNHSRAQRVLRMGNTLWLEQAEHPYYEQLPARTQWVIVGADGAGDDRAWRITAERGAVPEAPKAAVFGRIGRIQCARLR